MPDKLSQKREAKPARSCGQPGPTCNRGPNHHGTVSFHTRGGIRMIRAQTKSDPALVAEAACHDARALTNGANTALIVLDGQIYTLRITRAGKLILTK